MAADLTRVQSVPGQLALDSTVRDVLARARFEAFTATTGSTRRWEDQSEATRRWWAEPVECCVGPVHELVDRALAERRARLQWAIGAVDRTLAAGPGAADGARILSWCGHAMGQWMCSREEDHPRDVHAAGDGIAIVATCAVIP